MHAFTDFSPDAGWFDQPLAKLLAPLDPATFRSGIWGRQLRHVPGDAQKFAGLFDWSRLNLLLDSCGDGFRMHLVDAEVNDYFTRASLTEVQRRLRQGATLVLAEIDRQDPVLGRFLDALSAELGINTFLNLYLSSPQRPGFPLHYDTHDFLILQISGYKDWALYPPTLADPLPSQNARDQPPPPESARLPLVQLAPGDLLYVPKGTWHRPQARFAPSLHLTLGLYAPTGVDLLRWLVQACSEQAAFRRNLPLPDAGGVTAGGAAWQAAYAELMTAFDAVRQTPQLLQRFERMHYAGLSRRQAGVLPLAASRAYRVLRQPYRWFPLPDGDSELVFAQTRLPLAADLVAWLKPLLRGSEFSVAAGTPEQLRVLAELQALGLIRPDES